MNVFTKLARETAEQYVKSQTIPKVTTTIPELIPQRACYVYIFQSPGRQLRGVHGSALPRQPSLAVEIIVNTIQAISQSTRTIRRADLRSLSYTVAVIAPLQRISNTMHLDPKLYGLYLKSDRNKTALVLPNRPGIETADDQIATAIREAGIQPRQEVVTMYRFLVTYYE